MPLPDEVAKRVEWLVDGVGVVAPPQGHPGATSMLIDDGDVVLIDAGLAPAQSRALAPHVDLVVLSHCHARHTLAAVDFDAVWAPREEAAALEGVQSYLDTYGVAASDQDIVAGDLRRIGYKASQLTKKIDEGGILRLGSYEWHFLATPGHSPGHLSFLEPERHILFAGDLDAAPPWYGLPASDPTELERTAMALVDVPVAHLVLSHEAPMRRGIKPMFRDMAETIHHRDRLIHGLLERPHSLDELASAGHLSGTKPATELERYHEHIMVEKHLARLLERDFVHARQDGRFEAT